MNEPQRKRQRVSPLPAKSATGLDEDDAEEPSLVCGALARNKTDVKLPPRVEILVSAASTRVLAVLNIQQIRDVSAPLHELVTAIASDPRPLDTLSQWLDWTIDKEGKCGELVCTPRLTGFMDSLVGADSSVADRQFLLAQAIQELQHQARMRQIPRPSKTQSEQSATRWRHLCRRHPALPTIMAWLSSSGDAVQDALRQAGLDFLAVPPPFGKTLLIKKGEMGPSQGEIEVDRQAVALVPKSSNHFVPVIQLAWQRLYCIMLDPKLVWVKRLLKGKLPDDEKWAKVLEWLPMGDGNRPMMFAPKNQPYRHHVMPGRWYFERGAARAGTEAARVYAEHQDHMKVFEQRAKLMRIQRWPGKRELDWGLLLKMWETVCREPETNMSSLGLLAAIWFHVRSGTLMPKTPLKPDDFLLQNPPLAEAVKPYWTSLLAGCSGGRLTPEFLQERGLAVTGSKLLAWLRCYYTGEPLSVHATHSNLDLVMTKHCATPADLRDLEDALRKLFVDCELHFGRRHGFDDDDGEGDNFHLVVNVGYPGREKHSPPMLVLDIFGLFASDDKATDAALEIVSSFDLDLVQAMWDGQRFWHTPLHFMCLLTRHSLDFAGKDENTLPNRGIEFLVENKAWLKCRAGDLVRAQPGLRFCEDIGCFASEEKRGMHEEERCWQAGDGRPTVDDQHNEWVLDYASWIFDDEVGEHPD